MDRQPLDLTTDEEIDEALEQARELASLPHVEGCGPIAFHFNFATRYLKSRLLAMEFGITAIELPVRFRPGVPMSDEELERFGRKNRPLRIELEPNGEVLVMTPMLFGTGIMNQKICAFLAVWAMEDGRGDSTGSDGGYRLPNGAVRVPDACWVSNEKVATLPGGERHRGFPPFAPDFVIELRSENDRLKDIRAKMKEWIDNGAELGWMIDPKRRVVEVYRAGAAVEIHEDPTSVQGTGLVSGFCLVMKKVWG